MPIACLAKRQGGATGLFAVAMRPGATTATFAVRDGKFQDAFQPYAVHLYRPGP